MFQAKKSPRAKGSEAGLYLVGLRDSKEASVAEEELQRGRASGVESRA